MKPATVPTTNTFRQRPPRRTATATAWEPGRVIWWFESINDAMIANPQKSLGEIAKDLGRSSHWIHAITRSDSFQARLRERRDAHAGLLSQAIHEKAGAVILKGFEVLLDKFENPNNLTAGAVADVVDKTLEKLGYGAKASPMVQVHAGGAAQLVVVPATPADLKSAQETIRQLETRLLNEEPKPSGPVIEGEVIAEPIKPASE
jgi:hypothetical protein